MLSELILSYKPLFMRLAEDRAVGVRMVQAVHGFQVASIKILVHAASRSNWFLTTIAVVLSDSAFDSAFVPVQCNMFHD
jgi:hypothetical protein